MNLWIPGVVGHEAVGELPTGVALGLIPPDREPPEEILDAEFLVLRSSRDRRLLELLSDMRRLRVLQTLSAGVDWVAGRVPTGIVLCDASGSRDVPVAEWVLATILASRKRLLELGDRQRAHEWAWGQSAELAGSTALILGYGSIGRAVEARLVPFGVDVIRVAHHARDGVHPVTELASLLELPDIVVVLLPLTPETRGLLDEATLSLLRPGALLVNAARGPIVDTAALLRLLNAGRLRAALDVTDPEPLPADHPLWDAPGVLITPHLAGDTAAAERRAFALVGDQVRRYVRGERLRNVVADGY